MGGEEVQQEERREERERPDGRLGEGKVLPKSTQQHGYDGPPDCG